MRNVLNSKPNQIVVESDLLSRSLENAFTELNAKFTTAARTDDIKIYKFNNERLSFTINDLHQGDRQSLVSIEEVQAGGGAKKPVRKMHTGPKGGKYYITGGRKVYC